MSHHIINYYKCIQYDVAEYLGWCRKKIELLTTIVQLHD